VLSGRHVVAAGGVHDHNAALARRAHVDVFHADAGPADDFQVARGLDHVGGHFRSAADHQALVIADDLLQFRSFEAGSNVYVKPGALENFQAPGGQRIADQDLRHVFPRKMLRREKASDRSRWAFASMASRRRPLLLTPVVRAWQDPFSSAVSSLAHPQP
jgi:hypothetical protein